MLDVFLSRRGTRHTCGTVQEPRLVEEGRETSDTPVGQCRRQDLWKKVGKHQTHLWDSAGGQTCGRR